MNISEQVKELRKAAKWFEGACFPEAVKLADEAADTIESLSANLADMERSAEDCGGGWILCSTGNMPDMGSTVLIQLKSERDGITGDEDRTFDISFIRSRDNSEWISPSAKYPLKAVKAWKPIKAYHKP